jgi:Tol biopolymer transport system component
MTRFAVLLLLPAVAVAAPVPKADDAARLLVVTADGKATLRTVDGKEAKVAAEAAPGEELLFATLSPDGKRVAYAVKLQGMDGDTAIRLRVIADNKPTELITIPGGGKGLRLPQVSVHSLFWSPDGKAVAGSFRDRFAKQPNSWGRLTNFRIDTASGERTNLHTVTEYRAIAFTPDGQGLVCTRQFDKPPVNSRQVTAFETAVTPTDKMAPTVVLADPLDLHPLAAFPDGKRWAVSKLEDGKEWKLGVYTAGERRPVWWDTVVKDMTIPVAVSPDGKRVVYALNPGWQKDERGKAAVVWVADADGKNVVKLWESESRVFSIDWR